MSLCLLFPQDPSVLCGFQFWETANKGLVAENNAAILSSPRCPLQPTTAWLAGSFLSFPKSSRWLYPCSEWTRVSTLRGSMSSGASPLSVYTRPHGSAAMPRRGGKRGGEREMREGKNPCLVLIQAFSSAFCPLPSWHILWWLPPCAPDISGKGNPHISLLCLGKGEWLLLLFIYLSIYFYLLSVQHWQCYIWPKNEIKQPFCEAAQGDHTDQLSGLFRSAADI